MFLQVYDIRGSFLGALLPEVRTRDFESKFSAFWGGAMTAAMISRKIVEKEGWILNDTVWRLFRGEEPEVPTIEEFIQTVKIGTGGKIILDKDYFYESKRRYNPFYNLALGQVAVVCLVQLPVVFCSSSKQREFVLREINHLIYRLETELSKPNFLKTPN